MKKVISILFALMLTLSFVPLKETYAKQVFSDVPTTLYSYDEIMYLLEKGVISESSIFGLNEIVSREEVAVMIAKAKGLDGTPRQTKFTDVPKSNSNSGYIQSAVEAGIIYGVSNDKFDPEAKVTRGQMAAFISRAYKLPTGTKSFKDVPKSDYFYEAVGGLIEAKIASGYSDGTFKPYVNLTREHIAIFIVQSMKYEETTTIKLTPIKYNAIKIDGNLYGYNHNSGQSIIWPFLTNFYELSINGEKHIVAPSIIDVRKHSEDLFGTQSGLFNFLQIVTDSYSIVPSENPFLDGNIQLTYSTGNWSTTNKDLVNSKLKLGYETKYQSATNILKEEWYEYDGKTFKNPSNYLTADNIFKEDSIRFTTVDVRGEQDLKVFINDLLNYWAINKEISYGTEGDLTFIEIKSK